MAAKSGAIALVLLSLLLLAACGGQDEDRELVIMTHNSFDIGDDVIAEFEAANNATIVIQDAGDSGAVLVRAILEKGNPSADLLYGLDNTYLGRALDEEIFDPYESPNIGVVPEHLILDPTNHVTSMDYGYVCLNFDKAYLEENSMAPPATLEELTTPDWKGKLVVQNPASSSPGLAFLIATVHYFGRTMITTTWTTGPTSGQTTFSSRTAGQTPITPIFPRTAETAPWWSATPPAPAAEVFFSEIPLDEAPTGNVLIDGATFLQIEGMGILKGANSKNLAKKFIDFALETRFQEDFPDKMFVYPVNRNAQTPDFFRFAEVPTAPAAITAAEISEKREQWIDEWTRVVLR